MNNTSSLITPLHVQAIVFDMDGVVFDTERLYFRAIDAFLQRRGQRYTPELARRMMGLPGRPATELMQRECQLAEPVDAIATECLANFEDLIADDLEYMPGLLTLLERLDATEMRRALATSTHRELTEKMLRQRGLRTRFPIVLTGSDVRQGKPHPEIYLQACRQLGVDPAQTLVLEDSLNGMRAALSAGCHCVAVRHEANQHFDLSDARMIIETLDDPRLLHCFPLP